MSSFLKKNKSKNGKWQYSAAWTNVKWGQHVMFLQKRQMWKERESKVRANTLSLVWSNIYEFIPFPNFRQIAWSHSLAPINASQFGRLPFFPSCNLSICAERWKMSPRDYVLQRDPFSIACAPVLLLAIFWALIFDEPSPSLSHCPPLSLRSSIISSSLSCHCFFHVVGFKRSRLFSFFLSLGKRGREREKTSCPISSKETL